MKIVLFLTAVLLLSSVCAQLQGNLTNSTQQLQPQDNQTNSTQQLQPQDNQTNSTQQLQPQERISDSIEQCNNFIGNPNDVVAELPCSKIPNLKALMLLNKREGGEQQDKDKFECALKQFVSQQKGYWNSTNLDFCNETFSSLTSGELGQINGTCCFPGIVNQLKRLANKKAKRAYAGRTQFQYTINIMNSVIESCGSREQKQKVFKDNNDSLFNNNTDKPIKNKMKPLSEFASNFTKNFKELIKQQLLFDLGNICTICIDPEHQDIFYQNSTSNSTDKKLKINKAGSDSFYEKVAGYMSKLTQLSDELNVGIKAFTNELNKQFNESSTQPSKICSNKLKELVSIQIYGFKPKCQRTGDAKLTRPDQPPALRRKQADSNITVQVQTALQNASDNGQMNCGNKTILRDSTTLFGDLYAQLLLPNSRPNKIDRKGGILQPQDNDSSINDLTQNLQGQDILNILDALDQVENGGARRLLAVDDEETDDFVYSTSGGMQTSVSESTASTPLITELEQQQVPISSTQTDEQATGTENLTGSNSYKLFMALGVFITLLSVIFL